MEVIRARNVNDAFTKGVLLLTREGFEQDSRAGPVMVMPCPVVTVYDRPYERVLFHAGRDANPFFHFMEALWMLAGRNDGGWLDQFVGDFSERFGEAKGGKIHGAYGYRWRTHFGFDQLETIIAKLKANPGDRQIVLQMWDAGQAADLRWEWKDRPCNTHAYFRVFGNELQMTVCCRSNDIIWGAYGANAVHFSVLQEYVAARLGVSVGAYYQISNNYHAYTAQLNKLKHAAEVTYTQDMITHIVDFPDAFDEDLKQFMIEAEGVESGHAFLNPVFNDIAWPMLSAYRHWRQGNYESAASKIMEMPEGCDWRLACTDWLQRRAEKRELKNVS